MRVYRKFEPENFTYPKKKKKILSYLRKHGEILVSAGTVEKLYYDFSDTRCASWLSVDEETLEAFADWLDGIIL